MKSLTTILALTALCLSGCQSYAPQRYTAMPDNTPVLKTLLTGAIKVDSFVLSTTFDASCRGLGEITPPVNMSFQGYIQTALADELKVAGLYDEQNPKVVLSGSIDRLDFSSSKGLTNGEWNINLKIISSNGRSMFVSESFHFETAFNGDIACRRTAEAFLPAVQDLITKIVRDTEFRRLLE